jgi:hypothetical protein
MAVVRATGCAEGCDVVVAAARVEGAGLTAIVRSPPDTPTKSPTTEVSSILPTVTARTIDGLLDKHSQVASDSDTSRLRMIEYLTLLIALLRQRPTV